MYLMGMVMLKRNWQKDQKIFAKSLELFKGDKFPVYIISYLEGSRICSAKVQRSKIYAKEQGLPELDHVLLPRSKGFIATVKSLQNSKVKYVYDLTLAYFHRTKGFGFTPSLWELITGQIEDYHFHLHVDRIPTSSLPKTDNNDSQSLANWVIDRFRIKNDFLSKLKVQFESKYNIKSKIC